MKKIMNPFDIRREIIETLKLKLYNIIALRLVLIDFFKEIVSLVFVLTGGTISIMFSSRKSDPAIDLTSREG